MEQIPLFQKTEIFQLLLCNIAVIFRDTDNSLVQLPEMLLELPQTTNTVIIWNFNSKQLSNRHAILTFPLFFDSPFVHGTNSIIPKTETFQLLRWNIAVIFRDTDNSMQPRDALNCLKLPK
ncbi:hypothetical protein CEXT_71411 [Caerostris extrusa]|uniref:Uncharacterized protein n=1 Tax=Caerostris extrusa TaxID=172846 RepID=A0AAV4MMB4_CAEEX|nr:hypothetical protein CEXT_71411 [Caerostris extrusa]